MYSPLLSFKDPKLEQGFLVSHRERSLSFVRVISMIGAIFILSFIWQDQDLATDGYRASEYRLFLGLPLCLIAWYLSGRQSMARFIEPFTFFLIFFYSLIVMAIQLVFEPGPHGLTGIDGFGVMLLLIVAAGSFANLRFIWALPLQLSILAAYSFTVWSWTTVDFNQFLLGPFSVAVMGLIVSASSAVIFEKLHRSNYESKSYLLIEKDNYRLLMADYLQARVDAENANQEKSRFLANMSHELRTPMHAIRNFIALSQKRVDDPKAEAWLSNAEKSADRLTNLLNNLLDMSKIESGKMSVNLQKTDITQLLHDAVVSLSAYALDKNIAVEFVDEQKVLISTDPALLTQVVINIVGNAIKYSPENSRVMLELQQLKDAEGILFCCTDEGIGFPAEEIDKAFDKFYQTTKNDQNTEGTGLGLAITKEIIDLLQGEIWIESPPKNRQKGSAIYVQIADLSKHFK